MRPCFSLLSHCAHIVAATCLMLSFAGHAAAAPLDILDSEQSSFEMDGTRAVAASPDGRHIYVCAQFAGSITTFAVDPVSGALTRVGVVIDGYEGVEGIATCTDVAVSLDGKHVYAAGPADDALAIFSRNAETGALTFVNDVLNSELPGTPMGFPVALDVSRDGAHVYVSAIGTDTICVFSRDASTGALTFLGFEADSPERLLEDPFDLALSPDGALLYVASAGGTNQDPVDALTTFERDPATGVLTLIDTEQDLFGGVAGLTVPNGIAASRDRRHVYVSANFSDTIAMFDRSAVDQKTSFIDFVSDADPGVDGLDGATGVEVTRDGAWVVAIGEVDDSVVLFARDAATGLLAFDRVVRDGGDPARLLDRPIGLALDPRGRFVYVVAFTDDAVTVLAPEAGAAGCAASGGAMLAWLARRRAAT